jgi:hypothetical protein
MPVSIPYWLGSKLREGIDGSPGPLNGPNVSIPYWLGSKLRVWRAQRWNGPEHKDGNCLVVGHPDEKAC